MSLLIANNANYDNCPLKSSLKTERQAPLNNYTSSMTIIQIFSASNFWGVDNEIMLILFI